ncbi:suppressor of fused domain protein [Streptomyces mirabilis]
MSHRDTPDRLSRYLEQVDALTGAASTVKEIEPIGPEPGRLVAICYTGVPEPGYVTGFTYGLSLSGHPDWTSSRPELSITVRTSEIEWASVPSRAVGALRGISAFRRGRVIGYMEPFVENSSMSSLLLADPAGSWSSGSFDLGVDESGPERGDIVDIIGAYPMYASEREFVKSNGFDAFWNLEWDRFDPLRAPAV